MWTSVRWHFDRNPNEESLQTEWSVWMLFFTLLHMITLFTFNRITDWFYLSWILHLLLVRCACFVLTKDGYLWHPLIFYHLLSNCSATGPRPFSKDWTKNQYPGAMLNHYSRNYDVRVVRIKKNVDVQLVIVLNILDW